MSTLSDLLGNQLEDDFASFDVSEIQDVLSNLQNTSAIDVAHAENLQRLALRGADLASEMIGKLIKTVSYLETKVNSTKNRVSLQYKLETGKATADQRKQAGESDPEVEELSIRLARAKGSKAILERKYDTLIKTHHFYKDLAMGMKKSFVGANQSSAEPKQLTGWE